jgi:hypothetical protein
MPVKITFDNVTESLSVMSDTLKKLDGRSVKVGVLGSANREVLAYATANEYSATITPKKGKWLAIPLKPELKGKSPREFNLVFKMVKNGKAVLAKSDNGKLEPYYLLVKQVVIPERSFIRSTFDDKANIDKTIKNTLPILNRVLEGQANEEQYLSALGLYMESIIKERIMTGDFDDNSPITVNLKGDNTPLRDTGRLYQSIIHEVD